LYPRFRSTIKGEDRAKESSDEDFRLDVVVAASGFKHKEQQVLEEVSSTRVLSFVVR
jgi:RIO kinase 2